MRRAGTPASYIIVPLFRPTLCSTRSHVRARHRKQRHSAAGNSFSLVQTPRFIGVFEAGSVPESDVLPIVRLSISEEDTRLLDDL